MELKGYNNLLKWEKEVAQGQNKKTPYGVKISKHKLFNDLYALSDSEKVIYITLRLFADIKGYSFPSMRLLANDLNHSKDTIRKYIWSLKEKGFIRIDIKRGQRGKRYGYWLLK